MTPKPRWKQGRIVYCQGLYICRVVNDYGSSISYVPLEGYGPEWNKGRTFTAAKDLFSEIREPKQKVSR